MAILRVPYTDPLPLPKIIPASATTTSGAIAALVDFLSPSLSSSRPYLRGSSPVKHGKTLLLTGAGISVASGLADYRGPNGTYTQNKTYRPIYYHEFCENHEARKRYWARSFLGWTNLNKARPNRAHEACGDLGRLGVVGKVITQNVDSFHPQAHPSLPTTELHGYLRNLVCITCRNEYDRRLFQDQLAKLNPAWKTFLEEMLASGALDSENPDERRKKGLKTNPDGDADVPDAPYTTFRYPACPTCLQTPPRKADGGVVKVETDDDGAWKHGSEGGVLKPAVIMFGESIPAATKVAAEQAVDDAGRLLVIGSSLATYSAWRLVKKAKEQKLPIGILNMGGARGEEAFFSDVEESNTGRQAVRISENVEKVLPQVAKILEKMKTRG
ncbi:uncharacterized protein EKO05_0004436 [Ascochyta rabiei]|uniref:NAD+ binding n=1 Tax=Didymella rabiei TaxID=5454 RepID=A0A163DNV9_DIDRA|nr:uncharacterized protein EKO05_0004436 [Ascochyta rabiei]KZM23281.1 NAD+ binding [Ascochyta rabiei]UPX13941.1 hypothetical protein EKO05_0004436 [Ascochyta rabiei]